MGRSKSTGDYLLLTAHKVHVGTPIEKCQRINTRLLEDQTKDGGYAEDIFDNLVYRFEEPNGMTRWDSPLFTVPYDDEMPPCDEIWETMVGSEGKEKTVKSNQATIAVGESLLVNILHLANVVS